MRVVKRTSNELVRYKGLRQIIVRLYPNGILGFKLKGCRTEELLSPRAAYDLAVKFRVQRERKEKRENKKSAR